VQIRIAPAVTGQQGKVAQTALDLIGVPFLLHGRSADAGLDCVGLAGLCLSAVGKDVAVPTDYRLRGQHSARVCAYFDARQFSRVSDGSVVAGDIVLLEPGVRQIHLAVMTPKGAVHAHLGLGRVVATSLPLPWPTIAQWRLIGD
jgi:cell wall-associated NlpC family hydrolase